MLGITIICENTAGLLKGVLGEHGFSAFIEFNDNIYLFDTGQGNTIIHNARVLKKNLKKVEKIFLSHGHYDHTGGLKNVLALRKGVEVWGHPDLFCRRFAVFKKDGKNSLRSIGIPFSRRALENMGAHLFYNETFTEVAPNVYLTGKIPRRISFEQADKRLVVKKNGRFVQDPLHDDQSLVIETSQGLAVILGCSHSGLINTLSRIQKYFPEREIIMLLGGTHLGFLDATQLFATIESLRDFSIRKIGVSHCTGLVPAARLMGEFGDRFFFANAGSVIAI